MGRDLIIDGEARSHAVALDGSATVTGRVEGDLIVLGGDVTLGEQARVAGDVYVLGGRIHAAPGADIGGRSVAYPEASDLWVTLLEGPAIGHSAASRIVIGAKLALLAFWTLVLLLVFATSRRRLLATSDAVREEPFRNFFVGLTGVAAMMLTALFFSAFAGALLSVPLAGAGGSRRAAAALLGHGRQSSTPSELAPQTEGSTKTATRQPHR